MQELVVESLVVSLTLIMLDVLVNDEPQRPVPTENLIRTVRVTDRADVGPANDGNVSIAAVHSVNVDEWLASFGRSSGRRAACTVFRRRPSMAVVRPRDDGSCGAGRPCAASQ